MPELLQKETDLSEFVYQSVPAVIQHLKSQGWRVISLKPGELSEIVLRRHTKIVTLVAQENEVGTVHVLDLANH